MSTSTAALAREAKRPKEAKRPNEFSRHWAALALAAIVGLSAINSEALPTGPGLTALIYLAAILATGLTLYSSALHSSALYSSALHSSALYSSALHSSALQARAIRLLRVGDANVGQLLLAGWLIWAAIAPLGIGGFRSLIATGLFAAVMLTAFDLARTGGPALICKVAIGAFVIYLVASLSLVLIYELDYLDPGGTLVLRAIHPNQLSRIAAIAVLAAAWLASHSRGWRLTASAITALTALAIVGLTASRTGTAALAAGVVVLSIHAPRRRLAVLSLGLSFALLAVLFATGLFATGTSPLFAPTLNMSASEFEDNFGVATVLSGREVLWPAVWDLSLSSPIGGVGLGQAQQIIAEQIHVGWTPKHSHNLALHLLLTTGFIGAALAISGLSWGLLASARQQLALPFALLTLIAVDGFSEAVLRAPSFGWFALVSGVALVGPRALASNHGNAKGPLTNG